jgi:hypothetical protein
MPRHRIAVARWRSSVTTRALLLALLLVAAARAQAQLPPASALAP